MNWRWKLFWLKDKITGGTIKKVYKELERDYENFNIDKQQEKLAKLLKYAKDNCDFYNNYELNIEQFPVINKQIIKDNFEKIFVHKFNKNDLHKMSTSGSTGTPFTVYQNSEKRKAILAEVIFFGKKANFEFGEKEIYTRIWVNSVKKSKLKKYLQNLIPFDISLLDEDNLEKLDNTLKSRKVKCMLSYASTLYVYDKYLIKNNKNNKNNKYKIKSIISGSELLNETTRESLSKYFNCNVYSRYSNEENGLLGQDFGFDKKFWLNETNYYIEFLKVDSNFPAEPGELSRIVVTDLLNFAMPMIRYDTGDLCKFSIENNRKYITEIYGRRGDLIFNTSGKSMSPHVITNNMWEIPNIIQWKFIQLDEKEYKIVLNVQQEFNGEEKLKNLFLKLLGVDAIINFEYVNELPVLNSGKRKYIENLYKNK